MASGIVVFDMFKLRRAAESIYLPVQLSQPPMKRWIAGADISDVTLEMLGVDGVETHYRYVQPHVCFGDLCPIVVRAGRGAEVFVGAVEGGEKVADGGFVYFLLGCNAALVDPVVDVVVSPLICFLDLSAQILRQKIDDGVLLGEKFVEFGIQHTDNLAGLVVDDPVRLCVIENGNREASRKIGVYGEVEVGQPSVIGMDRVRADVLAGKQLILCGKAPA